MKNRLSTIFFLSVCAGLGIGATVKFSELTPVATIAATNTIAVTVNGVTNLCTTFANFASNIATNAAFANFVRTNDTNVTFSGSISVHSAPGTSPSGLSLSETSQVHSVTFQGADVIQTNVVILTVSNATTGVKVWQPAGVGTNQDHAVALLAGQFVTYDGTKYIGTNVFTNSSVVAGSGNGSTNYLIPLLPHPNLNDFNLGSSNVNIYQVTGGTLGAPIYWNAVVTNLSANTWGISFAGAGTTNRWTFSGVYGTNAPSVLTNNTALLLSGRTDGTNTWIGYTYFAPGL